MELGLYTFADVSPEPGPGTIGPHERLRNLLRLTVQGIAAGMRTTG